MREYHRKNTSGYTGVQKTRGRFCASVSFGKGLMRYIGLYDTAEEAHEQYKRARKAGPEFKKKWEGDASGVGKWVVIVKAKNEG